MSKKLINLSNYGFIIVPNCLGPALDANGDTVSNDLFIEHLTYLADQFSYPIDGIVFKFDDVEYGRSLGQTSHHFKNALAFKFADDTMETELIDIEWTMGRTGVLTPVAIFNPIELEGSVVSRASLHNISVMEEILGKPYVGQKVWVSKRNMIIPQIEKAEKLGQTDVI